MALETLKKRADFLRLARGAKAARPTLVVQMAGRDAGTGPLRVGFTASKKVGNSVARSRAKRRLRAAAEQVLSPKAAEARDFVLIARKTTLEADFADIVQDLASAVRKLEKAGK